MSRAPHRRRAGEDAVSGPQRPPALARPPQPFARVAAPLLLLGLVVVAYWPALGAGFVWDDRVLADNPLYRSARGLLAIWLEPSSNRHEEHYWPLTHTVLWVERALFGLDPRPFHAVSLALHAANSILVWRLLLRLAVPGALLGAALFAVHPLHVESVAWVIERKDLLSGLLFLAAFLLWLRHDEQGGALRLAGATLLQAGAMLAKSIAAALPLVLLLAAWWKRGRIDRRDLRHVAPLLVVTAAIALFDLRSTQQKLMEPTGLGPWERADLAGRALAFYLAKLAWPADLMLLHPRFELGGAPWGLLGFAALWTALWLARRRIGRGPVAGLTWFALLLVPVLGLVDFSYLRLSFVAERFAYLAVLGPLAVVAGLVATALRERTARLAAGAVLVGLLGLRAQAHARTFRDDETLFRHATASNPQAWGAWSFLAGIHNEQSRYEEARACAERALALRTDAQTLTVLARALLGLQRAEEALAALDRALELSPGLPDALNNRGSALDALGRQAEALASWEAAVAADGQLAEARSNLGIARARAGQPAEAEAQFRAAIGLRPDVAAFHSNLGIVLAGSGRAEQAVAAYREALRLQEAYPQCHNNLGVALDALGRRAEAQQHYRRALQLQPGYAQAQANLDKSLASPP